jgi:hypothetical protein
MQTQTAQAINAAYPVSPTPHPVLLTVRQFAEKHPAFQQGSLRNLIFLAENRNTSKGKIAGNGLDIALVRIGRKLLIDEAKFFNWVEAQQGGGQ